jgi:hypothetical protein
VRVEIVACIRKKRKEYHPNFAVLISSCVDRLLTRHALSPQEWREYNWNQYSSTHEKKISQVTTHVDDVAPLPLDPIAPPPHHLRCP